jgi:hypothetical protein
MRRGVLTLALLSAWLLNAAPAAAQTASEERPWVASAGIGGSFGTLGSYGGGLENLAVEVMGGRSISPLIAIVGEMGAALHAPQDKAKSFVSTDFSYIAAAALARPSTIHINGVHWNANVWITPQLNTPRFQPYVTAGYGGYTGSAVRETDFGLVHNNISTNPAGNVGGGVMVPVYRFVSVRADYRAYFISSDDSVNLNQFSVTVGVGGRR